MGVQECSRMRSRSAARGRAFSRNAARQASVSAVESTTSAKRMTVRPEWPIGFSRGLRLSEELCNKSCVLLGRTYEQVLRVLVTFDHGAFGISVATLYRVRVHMALGCMPVRAQLK